MSEHPAIAALKATAPADGWVPYAVACMNAAPHLLALVAELEGALEAARVAVADLYDTDTIHYEGCGCRDWSIRRCTCSAGDKIATARLALGLEVLK